MTATFSLNFAALSIDCADPAALADFWGKALGRPVSPGAVPGDMAVDATDPDSGPRMLFHAALEPETARNRLRPVLLTDIRRGDRRLTGLAPGRSTRPSSPAVRWTTFADPEGNEFDLVTWQPQ